MKRHFGLKLIWSTRLCKSALWGVSTWCVVWSLINAASVGSSRWSWTNITPHTTAASPPENIKLGKPRGKTNLVCVKKTSTFAFVFVEISLLLSFRKWFQYFAALSPYLPCFLHPYHYSRSSSRSKTIDLLHHSMITSCQLYCRGCRGHFIWNLGDISIFEVLKTQSSYKSWGCRSEVGVEVRVQMQSY